MIPMIDYKWEGGYYEGNPLDPFSPSTYKNLSNMSILHATYLHCIKPYIDDEKTALEIGPGRGAWSKCMLGFRKLIVMDPISPEETHFFDYVGRHENVHYEQITDFSCSFLQHYSIDYMFSFGCLCHVPFEGIEEYAKNLYEKLQYGADCFWMIADAEQHLRMTGEPIPDKGPGRWYDAGKERTCRMLEQHGYEIIDSDVGTCLRDPIIHFRKWE
jgi:hypothetical protein